ncbi:Phytoene dehydrogenase-related protein [Granulicella rosea]|uniref:Phytoene dehydrogenase-related protein n=1 Tax=Granulicella rosea TaxID=474952 RepID=A0A239KA79_9BACT|nr:NAD(P)/FAD-dependent oxidoreductase [Granulicella rosea]SNT14553.1 Phytoene dehydrogenase-related protein [Granulicella rosea]
MRTANIIGSGPNGLAAAITLAAAGVQVQVFEANDRIGGGCSSAELTLPGFRHDLGSSAYPMGVASPFFRSLPLCRYGFRWIAPELPLAHPLEGGAAVALEPALGEMPQQLGQSDGRQWRRLFGPLAEEWDRLVPEILAPIAHLPRHPLALARFGLSALESATNLARGRFTGGRARALFAGCAAHSVMPLDAPLSAAVGLVLGAAGHTTGWPVAAGGAQSLADALAAHLRTLGGEIHTGVLVERLDDLPPADAFFFDTGVPALERIAGDRLTPVFRRNLRRFRPGPGVFKVDWALSEAIPWASPVCRLAATVHVGGSMEEIVAAEAASFEGRHADRPFVLVVQPSVCDPSRAPAGKAVAWGYAHVPNGSTLDRTEAIEAQMERFAPGFRDCILARRTHSTAELESWNPNLVGGDLSGGAMTPAQMLLRPTHRAYGTSDPAIFLCSSSTPPGGGVHGMCGFHAARRALAG